MLNIYDKSEKKKVSNFSKVKIYILIYNKIEN